MVENSEINEIIIPLAAGIGLSVVFLLVDYLLAANYLIVFGLLVSAFVSGFLLKKPILYSIVTGAIVAIAASIIIAAIYGSCPAWAELLGKGIVAALIGNVIRSKLI